MARNVAPTGAHSQFRSALKQELSKTVSKEISRRAGPSFDARVDKAVKEMTAKAKAVEAEQKKALHEAVEKGRSKPNSSAVAPRGSSTDLQAKLQERQDRMREREKSYAAELEALRDKMDKREPLFRVDDVTEAFEEQRRRQERRRQQLADEEQKRWEHLREVEQSASQRPLLIQDSSKYREKKPAPRPPGEKTFVPSPPPGQPDKSPNRPRSTSFDNRINSAISQKWFQRSEWGKKVSEIKERADNRVKLHELQYPSKGSSAAQVFARHNLMHSTTLPSLAYH